MLAIIFLSWTFDWLPDHDSVIHKPAPQQLKKIMKNQSFKFSGNSPKRIYQIKKDVVQKKI